MAKDVFKEVQTRFLASLPQMEKNLFSHCSSAEQMVEDTSKLAIIAKDRIRGAKFIGKIKGFNEKISPYFEVIGIIIQSHPESAAIAWGALRLIFQVTTLSELYRSIWLLTNQQLASNFTTFFEMLVNTLERLTHSLPQYDLILELCKTMPSSQLTDRIKGSVRKVYENLFTFLQSVASIFTKKDGSSKRGFQTSSLAYQAYPYRFGTTSCCNRKAILAAFQLKIW
jgi:hypothetical protein